MYLFFVRHFNDIDHFTPIVWKMHKDNYPVTVYCMNPKYDIQNDYRLRFLKEEGINVDFVYNDYAERLGVLHRLMRLLFLSTLAIERRLISNAQSQFSTILGSFGQLAGKIGSHFYKQAKRRFYDTDWAHDLLEQSGAKALCFDWIRPHKHVVDVLLKVANQMSIPTISLPHGVFLYMNDSVRIAPRGEMRFEKYYRYDYIVVQNKLFKEIIAKAGIDKEKIFVLGSARYCNEWMAQNRKIIPRKIESNNGNAENLKLVFMTTRPQYRINVERMVKTFDILSNLSGIETVIKPHTRSGDEAKMYETVPLSSVSELSSVELCEWADVVLVIASSIIIESLTQGKPALYLKYLHENITEYEEFGACWTIHDENELQDALMLLRDGKRDLPYTDQNVKRRLREIIYGGRSERDVLKDYEDFIVKSAVNYN